MGTRVTAASMLLLGAVPACGGLLADDEVKIEPGLCARLCALQASCGIAADECGTECAWLEKVRHSRYGAPVYEQAQEMLDCVDSQPERLRCSPDGLTVTLAGCSGHGPSGLYPGLYPGPLLGGYTLSLADTAQGQCNASPPQVTVGHADPLERGSSPALEDGVHAFLMDLAQEEASIANRAISCQILATDGYFDFSLRLRDGQTRFEAAGRLDADGVGSARIAYQPQQGEALSSPADLPCSVVANHDPAKHGPAVRENHIWASFSCDALGPACRAQGMFLFEYCSLM